MQEDTLLLLPGIPANLNPIDILKKPIVPFSGGIVVD